MEETRKDSRRQLVGIVVMMVLVGTLAAVVAAFYKLYTEQQRAKAAVLHYATAAGVLTLYLKDHPGKWPHSWEELWANNKEHARSMDSSIVWIKQDPKIEQDVSIDFTLSLEDVARQEAVAFTAFQTQDPRCRKITTKTREMVLNVAREQLKRSKEADVEAESKRPESK